MKKSIRVTWALVLLVLLGVFAVSAFAQQRKRVTFRCSGGRDVQAAVLARGIVTTTTRLGGSIT